MFFVMTQTESYSVSDVSYNSCLADFFGPHCHTDRNLEILVAYATFNVSVDAVVIRVSAVDVFDIKTG